MKKMSARREEKGSEEVSINQQSSPRSKLSPAPAEWICTLVFCKAPGQHPTAHSDEETTQDRQEEGVSTKQRVSYSGVSDFEKSS